MSSQELNLRSILIQEHAKQSWARGLDNLGPLKLAIETSGFLEKLSVEKESDRGPLSRDLQPVGLRVGSKARRGGPVDKHNPGA